MRLWQMTLRFFDAHPWFLPSVAAVVTLVVAGYKILSWLRETVAAAWQRRQKKRIVVYLATQVNPGPFVPDRHGHTPRRQNDCDSMKIAQAVRIKPVKIRTLLEQLKNEHRVEQRGDRDFWCISDYELNVTQQTFESRLSQCLPAKMVNAALTFLDWIQKNQNGYIESCPSYLAIRPYLTILQNEGFITKSDVSNMQGEVFELTSEGQKVLMAAGLELV